MIMMMTLSVRVVMIMIMMIMMMVMIMMMRKYTLSVTKGGQANILVRPPEYIDYLEMCLGQYLQDTK